LKGTLKVDSASTWLRQGLVVFQFSLSIILVIGMIVIYRQIDYIQHKNLGFNRENLLYFPVEGNLNKKYNILKEEISHLSSIKQISHMTANPAGIGDGTEAISWPGSNPNDKIRFTPVGVGYDFAKTMKLELVAGREYSKDFASDSLGFIINETAQKAMGFKNPVGQSVTWGRAKGRIIGVVKDFHFQSLHTPIRPMITYLSDRYKQGNIIVRVEAGKTTEAIAQLEVLCKKINPEYPFTYYFTDEEYAKQYRSEQVVSTLSSLFAFLAIFISSLGLFGLAAFMAEQRTKEIGIRKVLGASVINLVNLLSKDFLKLVLLAFVISAPLAWYVANNWLQDFAYRTEISWWIFAVAGMLALLVAMLTVSIQAIKAALMNPVKSLKTE